MALEKQTLVDLIEIIESGIVQVRTKTKIMEDGNELSAAFSRHTIAPGQDFSSESDRVRAVCSATHTAEVISAYQAAQAARGV